MTATATAVISYYIATDGHLHLSMLVWQLPVIRYRIDKHAAFVQEWQCPPSDKPQNDDDYQGL